MTSTTMKRAAAGVATAALVIGGTAAVATGAAAEERTADLEDATTSWTAGVELTPAQADRLRAEWEADRDISPRQALEVTGVAPSELAVAAEGDEVEAAADEGYGEVTGDCSRMTLWGDSEGRWTWTNKFFPRIAGPAEFGRGTVTTDGLAASSSSFNITGLEQLQGDQLYFAGFAPSRTEASAWSLNYNASGSPVFCFGVVAAIYE